MARTANIFGTNGTVLETKEVDTFENEKVVDAHYSSIVSMLTYPQHRIFFLTYRNYYSMSTYLRQCSYVLA